MKQTSQKKQILLIEDDKSMRLLLTLFLNRNGYQVTEAENGFEGLLLLDPENIDLIILNLMMPVMDGIRFLQEVRQMRKLMIPIVLLTSTLPDPDKVDQELLSTGPTLILHKPVKSAELIQHLEKLLD
jgi:CheY-like chemotaxis protein